MKQKIKILALLPILLGSRVSCSGNDSSATSGASSGNGTSQNSSKGTIQINRWHTFGAGLQDEFQNNMDINLQMKNPMIILPCVFVFGFTRCETGFLHT